MKRSHGFVWIAGMCLSSLLSLQGQQPSSTSVAEADAAATVQNNRIAVPRLVKFSGTLNDISAVSLNGTAEVTFALYKQEADQQPVWTETQSVQFDPKGNYTVLLGASQSDGLPAELFTSAEAHWLGVEIQGQPQSPRTLLVSVPYALKAVDAEKLGGKSLSDFVLSESLGDQVRQVIQTQAESAASPASITTSQAQSASSATTPPPATASGPNFPPSVFSGSNNMQIVLVQQKGTGAGLVSLTPQNTALTGIANGGTGSTGVFGQTGGTNSTGVVGIATSTSTSTYQTGVYGQTNGAGSGVTGLNFASTGYTSGIFGSASSPTGSGVYGTSVNWVGIGGQATATSGGPAYGVWGDSLSTEGVGVAGYADAITGPSIAVYGADASDGGSAIFGNSFATSGGTAGVVGQVTSPHGTAGVFYNASGQGLILQGISGSGFATVFTVDAAGNMQISGNLTVSGTKSSTAKLQNGREVLLYAVESPENWFEDFGSGELNHGAAWIPLNASFAQATNATLAYHVFITANGDSNGLYVARKTSTGFEVREHGGGASTLPFDYRIVAKRHGYESVRMAEVTRPKVEVSRRLLGPRKPIRIPPVASRQMPLSISSRPVH